MNLRLDPRAHAPRALAVQAMGILCVAGGLLAAATAVVPPAASGSEAVIVVVGAASALAGVILLVRRPLLGELALGALTALGTALITFSTHEGGPTGGTADNEILYLWIALYAFYFLTLPNALLQLAIAGGAYAWLVSDLSPTDEWMTQWLVTMSTLLVAGVVAAALRGNLYRLVDKLSERASRDELTGLLNRGTLMERFELEHRRSRRDDTPISMVAVDVDEFKALNDALGHPTGDKVLREVGATLEDRTREIDAAARVGGDEFAVLLPGAGGPAAMLVAKDLRTAIARSPAIREVNGTVSVGVSTTGGPACGFGELWQAADAAMYEAKREGGDGVRFREAGAPRLRAVEPRVRVAAHP